MNGLLLTYEVPICGFRPYESREFQDSLPVPPPSTVFGMLLALAGLESDAREGLVGCRLAVARRTPQAQRSVVLRRMRRGGSSKLTRNPEYQELLTGFCGAVALKTGSTGEGRELLELVHTALSQPEKIARHSALSLGESAHMLDSIRIIAAYEKPCEWLIPDKSGNLDLTIWIDTTNPAQTRKERFRFETQAGVPDSAWITIAPN